LPEFNHLIEFEGKKKNDMDFCRFLNHSRTEDLKNNIFQVLLRLIRYLPFIVN